MGTKQVIRNLFMICLVIILAVYAYYSFNSGRVFAKAVEFQSKGRSYPASLAWQVVIFKFPFSIMEPAAKLCLITTMKDKQSMMFYSQSLIYQQPDFKLSLYHLPACGLFFLVLYGVFAPLFIWFGHGRRKSASRGLRQIIYTILASALLIVLTIGIDGAGNEWSYLGTAVFSLTSGLVGLALLLKLFFIYREKNAREKNAVEPAEPDEEPFFMKATGFHERNGRVRLRKY